MNNTKFENEKDGKKVAAESTQYSGKDKGFNKKKSGKFKKGKGNKYSKMGAGHGRDFNDPSFYMKNAGIAESFAKLPFNYIVGNKIAGLPSSVNPYYIQAVASYLVDWCVDVTANGKSGTVAAFRTIRNFLSQVATIIYTKMRRANSGSTNNIEYVDPLISNLLASIDILVNSVYASRCFKIANSFTWKNRLQPQVFFDHMNIDYDDFVANLANYRGRFQVLVAQARTIRTLAGFPFVQAILAEFANIFKDSDTDTGREQLMIAVKPFHHIYDPVGTNMNPGGMVRIMRQSDLESTQAHKAVILTAPILVSGNFSKPNRYKFSTLLDIMEVQIKALINDNDFNLIQADLEKAFGDSGYIVMDALANPEETISPIYSGEFCSMMHNGNFMNILDGIGDISGSGDDDDGRRITYLSENVYANNVYQHKDNGGETIIDNYVAVGRQITFSPPSIIPHLLDTDLDNPSPADIFIMTRYKTIWLGTTKANFEQYQDPEFLPTSNQVTHYAYPELCSNFLVFGGYVTCVANANAGMGLTWYPWNNMANATNFMMIPLLQFTHRPLAQSGAAGNTFLNDINNIRAVENSELENLHKAALLSLWNLPEQSTI